MYYLYMNYLVLLCALLAEMSDNARILIIEEGEEKVLYYT
jgi:hypothetical protein